jgi:hypothetical protein
LDDDRLRDSLHHLADQGRGSEAPPPTLIRRARLRLVRNVSIGVLALAAITIFGVTSVTGLTENAVPPAHLSPTPVTSGAPSPQASPRAGSLVFLYSYKGDLYGEYRNGSQQPLVRGSPGKPIVNATLSSDKKTAVIQIGTGRKASLSDVTLRSGHQCCFRDGSYPSFGPHQLVAREQQVPRRWIAIGVPTSEASGAFPLPPPVAEIQDLSWARSGKMLFYEALYRKGQEPIVNGRSLAQRIFEGQVAYGRDNNVKDLVSTPVIPIDSHPGDVYEAPSAGAGINVLKVCCQSSGAGTLSTIELGTLDPSTPGRAPYTKIADLKGLGIDPQNCRCFTADGGGLSARPIDGAIHWINGAGQSWFVGDGIHLWWVGEHGDTLQMPFGVTGGISLPSTFSP